MENSRKSTMVRGGRGKQLVAMVTNQEIIYERKMDTNKENISIKEQINAMNKTEAEHTIATMMVLKGDSMELEEISLPNNNLIQDEDNALILPEDLWLNLRGDDFQEISIDNTSPIQNPGGSDVPLTQRDNISTSDATIGNIDNTSPIKNPGGSDVPLTQRDNISTSDATIGNIDNTSPIQNPGSSDVPLTQRENISTSDATIGNIEKDPNNHNMDEGRRRKRKADPSQWKRNLNKTLRMDGKPYIGFQKESMESKKVVQNKQKQGRRLKETCKSKVCKKASNRHCEKFTEEQRTEIFKQFWAISWKERKTFVCAHVTQVDTIRNTVSEGGSRRNFTMEYRLNNGSQNGNVRVCREMFLNTLGIGYRMMQGWVKKSNYNIPDTTVSTGHRTSERTSNSQRSTYLKQFLDSLPKMPSHYARQNSSKLYLEPVFTTKYDVYKLYKGYCNENSTEPFSFKKFREVFVDQNLSLFCVKKDKCNTCSSHETGNVSDVEYNEHVEKKNRARQEKDQDKQKAEKGEIIILQVDFQAVKLSPFTYANAFYYKTKLACHNQTIMNVTTKHVKCYWFSEDQNNQLVASTFASCLLDYLHKFCVTQKKTPIIIYSDGCTAQNRNNILANALLNFSINTGIEVYQKFLEVGHTQMEVDSVHACIERKLKNREIKLPSDYVTITKEARTSPSAYEAVELDFSFFKDYSKSAFQRYSSIRPGRTTNDPCVTDIKVIFYNPEGVIKVKLDFTENWMDLRHRPKKINPIHEYPSLFTERCKITKTKWQHLQELKTVIPRDCHSFYDNLLYI